MADFHPMISYSTTATIASGATTSGFVDLLGWALVGIIMPATFTGSSMTFQMSDDDSTYYTLYNKDGNALSATVAASRCILFTPGDFVGVRLLKFVSGSTEGGSRSIKLISRRLV